MCSWAAAHASAERGHRTKRQTIGVKKKKKELRRKEEEEEEEKED